jgi:enoyl-CoA hydratase
MEIMTAGMVTADEAYRTGLVNHVVPQVELMEFCNGVAQKNHEKLLWRSAKLSSQLMLIIKTVKMKTEIKSFGKCFGTILKKELQPFREKKSSIYGRIINSVK